MSELPSAKAEVDQLFSALYQELRQLARRRLHRSEKITLLDTTALVHESYLRFLKAGRVAAGDRTRFLAYAAQVMRSVIVDFVRRRRATRRGGDGTQVTYDPANLDAVDHAEKEIIRVNDALDQLAKVNMRMVRVVEMRYFAGLDEQEIAASLGVTDRTVRREWEKARLLLSVALK
jgi:RNA polymerase sigma factor (TIGR02999 family)